jgi:Raf kinase inhibitor-like YbhB/YbcL family protein
MKWSRICLPSILFTISMLSACGAPQAADEPAAPTQAAAGPYSLATPAAESAALETVGLATAEESDEAMALTLTSTGFDAGGVIPPKYSCDGEDLSPPLAWSDPPPGTQSFALILDDPDAPGGTWVHWVLFNFPAAARSLSEGISPDPTLADGTVHGTSSFNSLGYGGPCPPGGTHRYFFKLYALDAVLDLEGGATKADLEAAMETHVLAQAELMGTYSR